MSPKLKLAAYAVLVILSVWFAWGFYSNYSVATKPEADSNANAPAPTPATTTNTDATNSTHASATTNADSTPDPNAATPSAETNVAATPDTNTSATSSNVPSPAMQAAKTAAPAPDTKAARGSMIGYLAAFVGAMIGLGLLIANDVTQFVGSQAVDFLFNDAGEGQRDPEYERAEAEWANGKFLEAIEMMRDFLKKHPREIYAALRIAEIYEKDLKNPLASALEYEEVLKNKLPSERWGWAAIHLCNLYSKLNQSDKALALLRRVAEEYPKTSAAKKARARLGIAEPEPDPDEEEANPGAEPESTEENQVISIEEHPPELEPRKPIARPIPPPPSPIETSETPDAAKPNLPPGFRKKK